MYNYSRIEAGAKEFGYTMEKVVAEVKKISWSLMVRIPAETAKEEGIEEGDRVEIQVAKLRSIGFGAYPDVGPMTREDELDTHD